MNFKVTEHRQSWRYFDWWYISSSYGSVVSMFPFCTICETWPHFHHSLLHATFVSVQHPAPTVGWSRRLKELIMNHLFMLDIVTYSISLWIGHISKRILGMTIFSVFGMVRTPIDRAVQWTLRISRNVFASINSVIQLINGRQRNAEIPVYRLSVVDV